MKRKYPLGIKDTPKYGRGLFATRKIRKGEVVEISPVVELEPHEVQHTQQTRLNTYVFGWRNDRGSALALGFGSLFNHSSRANITYNQVFHNRTIIFVALKDIPRGHQCFIDYGYDPKHGIEVTERNQYNKLKEKFEPQNLSNLEDEKKE